MKRVKMRNVVKYLPSLYNFMIYLLVSVEQYVLV